MDGISSGARMNWIDRGLEREAERSLIGVLVLWKRGHIRSRWSRVSMVWQMRQVGIWGRGGRGLRFVDRRDLLLLLEGLVAVFLGQVDRLLLVELWSGGWLELVYGLVWSGRQWAHSRLERRAIRVLQVFLSLWEK